MAGDDNGIPQHHADEAGEKKQEERVEGIMADEGLSHEDAARVKEVMDDYGLDEDEAMELADAV